jgi:5-methylcytosine-specific restriction endonuclease McrA
MAARREADGPKPETRCCSKCKEVKPLTSEFFKTGIQYKHGLSAECKFCLHKRTLEWQKTDAGKALRKRLEPKYKEWRAEYAKTYQKANRKRINAYVQSWREKNRDHCRELDAAWARKNKAKRTEYRHIRRAAGEFSYAVIPELRQLQKGKCAICAGLLTKFIEIDHIMPVALGGTNERTNLQLLCRTCNRSKGAKHPVDYMQSRGFLL